MNITLYANKSAPNVISKSIGAIETVSGHLNEACSVTSPSITLAYSSNALSANYLYIPAFSRYYYINDKVIDGDTITITAEVDPLMSFQSGVLNSQVIAERSSSNYDGYLNDPYVIGEVGYNYHTMAFPYTFANTGTYVVMTTGS